MSVEYLFIGLAAISAFTTLTTEGIKKLLDEAGKTYSPNLLAAVVAVTKVMDRETFLVQMRDSYKHKFAKKPEVIDGNMKALEMAYDAIMAHEK